LLSGNKSLEQPRSLSENSRLQKNRPSRIEPVRRSGSFFGKIKENLL